MATIYFPSDKSTSSPLALDDFAVVISGANDVVSMPEAFDAQIDEEYIED